jgi:hypothetical protein
MSHVYLAPGYLHIKSKACVIDSMRSNLFYFQVFIHFQRLMSTVETSQSFLLRIKPHSSHLSGHRPFGMYFTL